MWRYRLQPSQHQPKSKRFRLQLRHVISKPSSAILMVAKVFSIRKTRPINPIPPTPPKAPTPSKAQTGQIPRHRTISPLLPPAPLTERRPSQTGKTRAITLPPLPPDSTPSTEPTVCPKHQDYTHRTATKHPPSRQLGTMNRPLAPQEYQRRIRGPDWSQSSMLAPAPAPAPVLALRRHSLIIMVLFTLPLLREVIFLLPLLLIIAEAVLPQ